MDPIQKLKDAELAVRYDKNTDYLKINFRQSKGIDPLCEYVSQIPKVDELYINHSDLTDTGLEWIGKTAQIHKLFMADTKITGSAHQFLNRNWRLQVISSNPQDDPNLAAEYISKTPSLEDVSMYDCNLTDEGLRHFSRLTRLSRLDVQETKVSHGFDELVGKCPITIISAGETLVDDETCQSFSQLKTLKTLYASETRITDEGLTLLAELPDLENLSIGNESISWEGLTHLTNIPKLNCLFIDKATLGTQEVEAICNLIQINKLIIIGATISKDYVEKIRHSLPKCEVDSDYDLEDE